MKTQDEITANNRLIAEFMGFNDAESGYFYMPNLPELRFEVEDEPSAYYEDNYKEEELKYHEDWNWLVPAVHQALEICHEQMLNEWEIGFSDAFLSCEIDSMYSELIDFIKWHNE